MTIDLDELAEGLSEFEDTRKQKSSSPRDDRVIAGFDEIVRFVSEHGRLPKNIGGNDIFERLYATRLEQIRRLDGARELLADADIHDLLSDENIAAAEERDLDADTLLAELEADFGDDELTNLTHVRSAADKRAAEEVASRTSCRDFDQFEPLFKLVQEEMKSGQRPVASFGKDRRVDQGDFFILGGQTVYVALVGDEFYNQGQNINDARLRVIYSNKTESNLLRSSLLRALDKDDASRRVAKDAENTLFGDQLSDTDVETGTIYVLRSNSEDEFISKNRDLIHKIGVTGGKIQSRIANAQYEATYLLAGVEVIREYKLVGINRKKLEQLLHGFFASARLEIDIQDRFGKKVQPREWFLVPLSVIDEVIERIRTGSIEEVIYDPAAASLQPSKSMADQ